MAETGPTYFDGRDLALQKLGQKLGLDILNSLQKGDSIEEIHLTLVSCGMRPDASIALVKKVSEFISEQSSLMIEDAQRFFNAGKYTEAINTCKKILVNDQKRPNILLALFVCGRALSCNNDYSEAVKYFQLAKELSKNHHLEYHLGNALFNDGRIDDAFSCYRASILFDPDKVSACFRLAFLISRWQGNPELPIDTFVPVMQNLEKEIPDGDPKIHGALAHFWRALKQAPLSNYHKRLETWLDQKADSSTDSSTDSTADNFFPSLMHDTIFLDRKKSTAYRP